jgi:lipopolysaccharide biosynthesis regulator YciM
VLLLLLLLLPVYLQRGWTPLHLAANTNNTAAVKLLLQYAANMTARNQVNSKAQTGSGKFLQQAAGYSGGCGRLWLPQGGGC